MDDIMLFPLGSVVLPEGKMKLRIFESRYKRMLSECNKQDKGFGICLFDSHSIDEENPLTKYGCYVKVVNYNELNDGLLGITVSGIQRFEIHNVRKEFDGLRIATVEWIDNWPYIESIGYHHAMMEKLQDVYHQFPDIGELYQQRFFDDLSWVTQRWLEILPLSNSQFDDLMIDYNCCKSIQFINEALNQIHS